MFSILVFSFFHFISFFRENGELSVIFCCFCTVLILKANSTPPIHEVVGRNVTKYSGMVDPDTVSQLGPENLHLSSSTADPDYLSNSSTITSSFDTDTSTLSGNH